MDANINLRTNARWSTAEDEAAYHSREDINILLRQEREKKMEEKK